MLLIIERAIVTQDDASLLKVVTRILTPVITKSDLTNYPIRTVRTGTHCIT